MTDILCFSPDDPIWLKSLDGFPYDFYHLPSYVSAIADHEESRALAYLVQSGEAKLFVPLIVRHIPQYLAGEESWFDARSPYGYGSPLAQGCDEILLEYMLRLLINQLREDRIVSVFIRLHPIIRLPETSLRAVGTLVNHGETVYVDLSKPEERIWAEIRNSHKEAITRLRTSGFQVSIDDWESFPVFQKIYKEAMSAISAEDYFFFKPTFFQNLAPLLGSVLHLLCVKNKAGEVASAGLYSAVCGLSQGFLSATCSDYRKYSPAKLMHYSVIQWAQHQNSNILHLGGGVGGKQDSLFEYKAGFSPLRAWYRTLRVVANPEKYSKLIARRIEMYGVPPGDFFPGYRID